MKKYLFKFIFLFLALSALLANEVEVLKVEKIVLENGLTILLNEDHTTEEVFGAVVVKAGGKHDPAEATGIAHYLEHMLFKGTETMGTVDYEKEKPLLDEINRLYDELAATDDEDRRKVLQMEINKISLEAAKYAIPNEFDRLMQAIGEKNLNASTGFERTMYYNSFPSEQIFRWLDIYAHRFKKPVFRLFQSELEAVYEEKNGSLDDVQDRLFEEFIGSFYKKHPYGQQTILGKVEHLKNPSLTKMYEFYNTYYVANNMALILSGDFDSAEVIPVIKEKFGSWRSGEVPKFPDYPEEPFKGREFKSARLTPVKIGGLGFRAVKADHEDSYALKVINYLLSNGSQTGYLDRLELENKILTASPMLWLNEDHGGLFVIFAPKVAGQSLASAEKLILQQLSLIKEGKFSKQQFEGAKNNLLLNFEQSLEDLKGRYYHILEAFMRGEEWEDYLSYKEKMAALTYEDVVAAANRYLTDDYLVYYSRVGKPDKKRLEKPGYEPVKETAKGWSPYAQQFSQIPVKTPEPDFVDFETDLERDELAERVKFFYNENPVNAIFSLKLRYRISSYRYPLLSYAANFMNQTGVAGEELEEFKEKMNSLGMSYSFSAGTELFTIGLNGPEEHLEEALGLLDSLVKSPAESGQLIAKIKKEELYTRVIEKKESLHYLLHYLVYREDSPVMRRPSFGEVLGLNSEKLIDEFNRVTKTPLSIHYTGQLESAEAREIIEKSYGTAELSAGDPLYIPSLQEYDKNIIYLINKPDAVQSQVYFYIKGQPVSLDEIVTMDGFNNYFGSGMSSLVFQEIREFRSLAYGAGARYIPPIRPGENGFLYASISCQADKTTEVVEVMSGLLTEMPVKKERLEGLKSGLINSVYTSKPRFRSTTTLVENWLDYGYPEDPSSYKLPLYQKITMEDIVAFYEKHLKGQPIAIGIIGNKSKIDLESLKAYGEIKIINKGKIFN